MPADPAAADEFMRWAAGHAHALDPAASADDDADLAPLRQIIGDARIVSFGEGLHGGAEPMVLRNRLFRYLVRTMGFKAIVLESGFADALVLNRYVLGGEGELHGVLERGLTHGFAAMADNLELVRWLRAHNAGVSPDERVQIHGMDASGGPDGMHSALFAALDFLAGIDAAKSDALRERIADLKPWFKLDRRNAAPSQYTELDQAQRDRLTATIADLVSTLGLMEPVLPAGIERRDFECALQTAIAARQVDEYLRQVPIGWTPALGPQGLHGTVAVADRIKADNIDWVLRQVGPQGRILLFAHRDHLAGSRSTIRLPGHFDAWTLPPMVGEYLKPRYGRELVTIAHLFASEAIDPGAPGTRAAPGSIEQALAQVGHDELLLDLRCAPPAVAAWLAQRHELFGIMPFNTTVLADAHDAVLFTRHVGPAGRVTAAPEAST